jgi:hypothetical protein
MKISEQTGLTIEQWQEIAQVSERIDAMSKDDLATMAKELYKHLTLTAAAYERQREFFLPYYREAVIGDMTSWSD